MSSPTNDRQRLFEIALRAQQKAKQEIQQAEDNAIFKALADARTPWDVFIKALQDDSSSS